jgi:hypothetical protein
MRGVETGKLVLLLVVVVVDVNGNGKKEAGVRCCG